MSVKKFNPAKAWQKAWTRFNPHDLAHSGIAVMFLAAFLQATMTAITKGLAHDYPSTQMIFFRSVVGILLIAFSFLLKPAKQSGGMLSTLLWRGCFGGISLLAFFYCITKIQLAFANTYNLTYPIFMGLILGLFYRRKLQTVQWVAILSGFLGIIFIFRPELGITWMYHILGLCTAAGYLSIHRLGGVYDHRVVVLSFLSFSLGLVVIGLILQPWLKGDAWSFLTAPLRWPNGWGWFWLILLGLIAYYGQLMITRAYSLEDPAVVGTINFMQIPFALGWGITLGDGWPDAFGLLGILIIMASGILITLWTRFKRAPVDV